jgi:ATP-dependent DNA helicase RecQ
MEYLREWRRELAASRGVPAFVILHDQSLAEICRRSPRTLHELGEVHGIGKAKLQSMGQELLAALNAFAGGARAAVARPATTSPADETILLLSKGLSFSEIAHARGRQISTVITQVADLIEKGKLQFRAGWVSEPIRMQIEELARTLGTERLRPIKDALPESVTYPEIRLVVAAIRNAAADETGPGES